MAGSTVHLLPWTIPKPVGLWYRSFVLVEEGIYVTPEMDFTSFEELKGSIDGGADEVLRVLTDHGRSKRSQFVPIGAVVGVAANEAAGTIHIKVDGDHLDDPMVRVPKRDQLPKVAKALAAFVKRARANSAP